MLSLSKHNWLTGTLELSSKVRYGLTSRGVPRFRFVPYDRRFAPFAVGCTSRDLFYNVHAVTEAAADGKTGVLIQNLGRPTLDSELEVLLGAYAYDSQKDLRKFPDCPIPHVETDSRPLLPPESTFHIDPPGCRDVDDTLTIVPSDREAGAYEVSINIADVDAWVPYSSPLRKFAAKRATSFYTPHGEAKAPMFPPELSEGCASLLPSAHPKPTLSLTLLWTPGSPPAKQWFRTTATQTTKTYTYDQAEAAFKAQDHCMLLLHQLANDLDPTAGLDSHKWISTVMIYYNCAVARILREQKIGILRRSAPGKQDKLKALEPLLAQYPDLKTIAFEAAEYCSADESTVAHAGLEQEAYCTATSPLRRYADLVNQKILKEILCGKLPSCEDTPPQLLEHLNRRQRQAKAFSKDLFYANVLSNPDDEGTEGVVVCETEKGIRVYVPHWNRFITVKRLNPLALAAGQKVKITWYEDKSLVRWKDKVTFQITSDASTE